MCFIIPSALASLVILKWFPDTRGLSLEECTRVFGDEDELFGKGKGDEEVGVRGHAGEQVEVRSGSDVRESKETEADGGEVMGERI